MKHKPRISFSDEDIRRYQSGQMTKEEMRRMELASLGDPFLADAMEGFMLTDADVAAKNIRTIESHIAGKEQKNKIIPFWNNPAFKAAAVVIIIGGLAWLSFGILNKKNEELAQVTPTIKKDSVTKMVAPADTNANALIRTNTAESSVENTPATSVKKRILASKKAADAETKAAADAASQRELASSIQKEKQELRPEVMVTNAPAGVRAATVNQSIEGKVAGVQVTDPNKIVRLRGISSLSHDEKILLQVTDENGKAIEHASVSIEPKKGFTTDKSGFAQIPASDTNKNVTITSIGFESKTLSLKRGVNQVKLSPGTRSLSEEVVVAYGVKKNKAGITLKDINLSIDTVGVQTPTGGWAMLQADLKKGLEDYSLQTFSGKFIISFLVNRNNSIRKMETEETDNPELSDAVIELLDKKEYWRSSTERIRLKISMY